MYAFACPKCGHKIESDGPVTNVPVRCGKCGMVFRGSATEVRDMGAEGKPGDVVGFGTGGQGPAEPKAAAQAKPAPQPAGARPRPQAKPKPGPSEGPRSEVGAGANDALAALQHDLAVEDATAGAPGGAGEAAKPSAADKSAEALAALGGRADDAPAPAPGAGRPTPRGAAKPPGRGRPAAPVRQGSAPTWPGDSAKPEPAGEPRVKAPGAALVDSSGRGTGGRHFGSVRPKKPPIAMVIVCGFGLAVIIVMIAVLYRLARTTDERVSVERARRKQRGPGQAAAGAAASLDTAKPPEQAPKPHPARDDTGPDDQPDGQQIAALKPGDPKIAVTGWNRVSDVGSDGSMGTVVGRVRSRHVRTVQRVDLMLQFVDKSTGKPVAEPMAVTCQNIPPRGSVSFSVRYDYLPTEKLADIDIRSSADTTLADKSVVSWMVDDSGCEHEVRDESIFVLSGSVRNRKPFTVTGVGLYAEFFSSDRIKLGSATGKLREEHNDRIRKGKTAFFVIEFDTAGAGDALPEQVRSFEIRLIGRPE